MIQLTRKGLVATDGAEVAALADTFARVNCIKLEKFIEPKLLDPDFEQRMKDQLDRLRRRYGVHIPGRSRAEAAEKAKARGITTSRAVVQRISEFAERYSA